MLVFLSVAVHGANPDAVLVLARHQPTVCVGGTSEFKEIGTGWRVPGRALYVLPQPEELNRKLSQIGANVVQRKIDHGRARNFTETNRFKSLREGCFPKLPTLRAYSRLFAVQDSFVINLRRFAMICGSVLLVTAQGLRQVRSWLKILDSGASFHLSAHRTIKRMLPKKYPQTG